MSNLTIANGDQAGRHFKLARRPLSIGREPSRDIQLIDPKVSRKHAMIRLDGDRYVVSVAQALNGVLVNGVRIEGETGLRDGDAITLGDTILRFSVAAGPDLTDGVHQRKVADRAARDHPTII